MIFKHLYIHLTTNKENLQLYQPNLSLNESKDILMYPGPFTELVISDSNFSFQLIIIFFFLFIHII